MMYINNIGENNKNGISTLAAVFHLPLDSTSLTKHVRCGVVAALNLFGNIYKLLVAKGANAMGIRIR